jgi:putative ABC transport system permease protein
VGTLIQDIRFGLRVLAKNPGFTVVAVLTLALGIGANTAIFSVVRAVLLRPLPYKDPDRVVLLTENNPKWGVTFFAVSPADFIDWQKQNTVFQAMAAYTSRGDLTLSGEGEAAQLRGMRVSASFFSLLGVQPRLGRTFLPTEDQPGIDNVVVLSHRLWERRYGADVGIIGRKLTVRGDVCTVIGVMPSSFRFLSPFDPTEENDVWLPNPFKDDPPTERSARRLLAVARLKPGVSIEQAQSEMDVIAQRLARAYPESNEGMGVNVHRLQDDLLVATYESGPKARQSLLLLMGAVGFVLLIACANVSGLLITRALSRQKEIAVRAAVGAGRLRLVRQLLTESLLLGLLGAGVGILLAHWSLEALITLSPAKIARLDEASIDRGVLAFAVLVSVLSALLFGLAPAALFSKPDLNRALKEAGIQASPGGWQQRFRSLLVVGQIGMALVLLVGAGLMVNSLLRLQQRKLGFDPNRLLTMEISLPRWKYAAATGEGTNIKEGTAGFKLWTLQPQGSTFAQQVLQRLEHLPGVESAAVVNFLPMGLDWGWVFEVSGRAPLRDDQKPPALYKGVAGDYFTTLRIPLLQGRLFTRAESMTASGLAVINQTMARRFFPDGHPLGQHLKVKDSVADKEATLEIIGVVGDVRQNWAETSPENTIYMPLNQEARTYVDWQIWFPLHVSFVARTRGNPRALANAVRKAVAEVDPSVPIEKIRTIEEFVSETLAERSFYSFSLIILASVAVFLALIGIYGVMAYSVGRRTHEIGIRIALGAERPEVLRLVMGQGLRLALLGGAAGLAGAFTLTRFLSGSLYGVQPTDAATFVGASVLLLGVAMLACYIPARRASKVDPMVALRYE